jgi:hypothetical protein
MCTVFVSRVNRRVCEKIAQNVAQPVFSSNSMQKRNRGKKCPKNVGYFLFFQKYAHSKQSPNVRKFAQSGHPVFVASKSSWASEIKSCETLAFVGYFGTTIDSLSLLLKSDC